MMGISSCFFYRFITQLCFSAHRSPQINKGSIIHKKYVCIKWISYEIIFFGWDSTYFFRPFFGCFFSHQFEKLIEFEKLLCCCMATNSLSISGWYIVLWFARQRIFRNRSRKWFDCFDLLLIIMVLYGMVAWKYFN